MASFLEAWKLRYDHHVAQLVKRASWHSGSIPGPNNTLGRSIQVSVWSMKVMVEVFCSASLLSTKKKTFYI